MKKSGGSSSLAALGLATASLTACSSDSATSYWSAAGEEGKVYCQEQFDSGVAPVRQVVANGHQLLSFADSRYLCEPDSARFVLVAWKATANRDATHQLVESSMGPFGSAEFGSKLNPE